MVQYRVENLLSLLQAYIKPNNPNHDVLEAEYVAWIDDSPFLNDAHKKAWKRAELPLLMSRVFPESDQGPLRVSLEYMMLFLMLEQLTDTPATAAEAQKWADIYVQAFKQTLSSETTGPASAIKHLASRVLNAFDEAYRPNLIASNVLLAEGVVKEALDRENPNHDLSLQAYMETRRDSIGLRPFLDFGRWIWKLDIPQDILSHPGVAKLEEQTIDMVSLANDLYSYRKEFFESGAHHNYVTVVMQDPIANIPASDRQAAIDYTCKRFTEILTDFHRCKKELPSFGENVDKMIGRYISVMMDLVVGNIQWSLACRRYGHFDTSKEVNEATWGEVTFDMDPL
ncbi:isoprenoid synthase domain-containing protein [Lyophyllum atratum]|nr:isoprenoid synthase domain-containing protein [Lyophyllum atratum]